MAQQAVPKIEGKLGPKTLSDLLKKVEGNRGAAYLLVSDGLSEKCLYFTVGAIRLTSMGRRRGLSLMEAIAAHPKVDPKTLEAALAAQESAGRPAEETLAAEHGLGDLVRECSTAIARDEMLDLLLWDGAHYEYAEANPPPKIFDPRLEAVKLSFGVAKLLKEAIEAVPKAQHLLQRVAGRGRVRPGAAWKDGVPPAAEKAACFAIAEAVKTGGGAGAPFDEIVVAARRKGVDALRLTDALEKMFDARTVEPPKKGESAPLPKAEEAELARREVEAIEQALDLMINELVARQRLARGYLAIGDQAKAVFNLKRVGEELLQRNKGEEAISVLREVVKIVPHDFGVREKIAFLYEKMKRVPEAIAEGLDLARLYKQFGLFNRAKNIFRRIINLEPENVEHRRSLIELLLKLKQQDEAVEEYRAVADLYARRNEESALAGVYREILAIDEQDPQARERLRAFARRRPGFWVPYALVASGFVILVIVAAYVSSEYAALERYREARRAAFDLVDRDPPDYAQALKRVDDFLLAYADSRVAGKAKTLRGHLVEVEEERRERKARDRYGRARQLEEGGHADKARETYLRLLAEAKGTKWERESSARIAEIDKKNELAETLEKQVKRLRSDQRWAEAFEAARDLVRQYPWSAAARRVEARLAIESVPPGAKVMVDGRPVSTTPCTIEQRAAEPFTLTLLLQGFDPRNERVDLREGGSYPLRIELRRALRWKAVLLGPVDARPLVEDDAIYVGGRDQRVYALDPEGNLRWSRALGLFADVAAQPLRAGKRIVVGDRTGWVTALEAATGEVAWRARLGGAAAPIVAPGPDLVVVADAEESVVGFDATSGKERWRVRVPGGLAAEPAASPEDGSIVVPSGESLLLVLDAATGAERARLKAGARPTAPPAVAEGGAAYVVATEGGIVRCISRDGSPRWNARAPGAVSIAPVISADAVFIASGRSLISLDLATGRARWREPQSFEAAIGAPPAFRAGRMYVATGDGSIQARSAETGALVWTYRTEGEIVAQPVPRSDTVYVASTDFGVYAIRE